MKNKDECLELKNIKYKTMLMNNIQSSKEPDVTNIESFLEKEKTMNKKQHWSKLSKLSKKNKILDYCIEYSKKHNLNEKEISELKSFLLKSLDRKKLQRVKDVIYDVENPRFFELLDVCNEANQQLIDIEKSEGNGISKLIQKIPAYAKMASGLIELYLLPVIETDFSWTETDYQVA